MDLYGYINTRMLCTVSVRPEETINIFENQTP